MQADVTTLDAKKAGTVELPADVFGLEPRPDLLQRMVRYQLAKRRAGTHASKGRADINYTGAKLYRQKGTGRARQGSIRAPHYKGGGVAFGPRPRSYRPRTPKRVRRLSLLATLSDKAREGRIVVIDKMELDQPKTREMAAALDNLNAVWPVLLVADGSSRATLRSAGNIPRLKILPAALLNTLDLLSHRTVIMTVDAVRKAEDLWGGPFVRRPNRGPAGAE